MRRLKQLLASLRSVSLVVIPTKIADPAHQMIFSSRRDWQINHFESGPFAYQVCYLNLDQLKKVDFALLSFLAVRRNRKANILQ